MTKRKPERFGRICHPGGREIEIVSAHPEWLDWAQRALNAHDDLVAALKRATSALAQHSHPYNHAYTAEQLARAALARAKVTLP